MTPIFPSLPFGFSVHKRPTFSSVVLTAVTGREVGSARQGFPLWEFELTFEILRDQTLNIVPDLYLSPYAEFRQAAGAFMEAKGQVGEFFFNDPSDNSRSGQLLGRGDGIKTVFRFVRDWGTGLLAFAEPVGGVNTLGVINIYVNGVITAPGVDWTIDSTQRNVILTSAPGSGVPVADFSFFYRCRFLEDSNDFEQFFSNRWTLKALKFRSIKP